MTVTDIQYKIEWTEDTPGSTWAADVTLGSLFLFTNSSDIQWETPPDWPLIELFNYLVRNWDVLIVHANKNVRQRREQNLSYGLLGVVTKPLYVWREDLHLSGLSHSPNNENVIWVDWNRTRCVFAHLVEEIYSRIDSHGRCDRAANIRKVWSQVRSHLND